MVEGTFAQLNMDKDLACSNPSNVTTNTPKISQLDSSIRKYRNYIYKDIGIPRAALQLLYKVGLGAGDSVGDSEGCDINGSTKLFEAQFSPLLAKSCRCSAILGGYNYTIQQLASDFAMHLSLAEQVRRIVLVKNIQ